MIRSRLLVICLPVVIGLTIACSTNSDPSGLSGTIEIDGSSTVYLVSEAVAEDFSLIHGDVRVNVGISGTGGGFKRFVAGETDISDASRPIEDNEAAKAAANGVEYHEFLVGTDGITVVLNKSIDFVDCLSVSELRDIWEPGSVVNNWNQIRSSFPNRPISLYGPDTDSGTFDYFTEAINGESQASRSNYTYSPHDDTLVRSVSIDDNAMGYFGYAYYAENSKILKLLAIDSGYGCVKPTLETIASGSYSPLSRPLYIYVNARSLERTEMKSFVQFYMENASRLLKEVNYIPLPDTAYFANLERIE